MLRPENHVILRTFIEEFWEEFLLHCDNMALDSEEAEAILKELEN